MHGANVVEQNLIKAFCDRLPKDAIIIADSAQQSPFLRDQAITAFVGKPLVVLVARTENEIVETMKFASSEKIPVIIRGAGSGLAGGANAVDGCIVISLERMNKVLEVNWADRYARVQAGVITSDLDAKAREVGLTYLPDPASKEWSTIGGNVATNAGGMCCMKYGVTRDHVLGLRMVMANGEIVNFGGITQKRVTTLDFTRLVVGSEGVLGIITEVTVKLSKIPNLPTTMVATFSDIRSAASASQELVKLGPSMLEIIDHRTLALVEEHFPMGLIQNQSLVIFQDDNEKTRVLEAESIAIKHGALETAASSDPADSNDLIAARRLAFLACEKSGVCLLDDVVVPLSKIADLVEAVENIGRKFSLNICVYGHAGDGNMHPTIVYDHGDEDAAVRAVDAFNNIVIMAQKLGGTASGEHGIGTIKNSLAHLEISQTVIDLQFGIKKLFDPAGILNPGRKL